MTEMNPSRLNVDLSGDWSFAWSYEPGDFATIRALEESRLPVLEGRVPGNFELDLQRNKIIDDPFFGLNIVSLRKYETAHVWYFRRFNAKPASDCTPVLVFDGVDCFADIFVNGVHLGSCANMLVEHVFPLDNLEETDNELVVHIRPAIDEARKFDYPPGVAAQRQCYEGLYVRKAPHSYGWDIMPRAVSMGIWRPLRLEFRPRERLATAWLETVSADKREASLALRFNAHLDSEPTACYEIEILGRCGESEFHERARALFDAGSLFLNLKNPHLWWPRGRGEQALYSVEVRLLKNGVVLDQIAFRHGIRTVELRRTSTTDSMGSGEFCFLINGERTFICGTNWVPADAYHSRDAERIPRILALVDEIGCNMLRCWGGSVYESDAFFDFCDEHGIMVWQDFAMACALYPQDDEFCRILEDEVRKVVRRLRSHPSLVVWTGDNECDQVYAWFGFRAQPRNRLTREVLPMLMVAEDSSRPYLPSSPYIDEAAAHAGETFLPENHLWGPRDYFKSAYYSQSLCHFASEIGYHGCPSAESVRKFISPDKLWPPGSDEWLLHSTAPIPGVELWSSRTELMCKQTREMFGAMPDNLEDFAFQSQCVQAEAMKFFIELFRGTKWRRTGIIWWNLMDGWPQFSDAVVDYYFSKKLAFDFIRRAQQPLLMMLREPQGWSQDLVICNETRTPLEVKFTLRDADDPNCLVHGIINAAEDATTLVQSIPFTRSRSRFLIIEWESALGCGINHYLAGDPPFDARQYGIWIEKTYL